MGDDYSDDESMHDAHAAAGHTQHNVSAAEEAAAGTGQWSSGLFDLCCENSDPSDHFYAYCCPCFTMGVAKSRADQTDVCFNCCCFPFICTSGVYGLVRVGYGIQGSAGYDCLSGSLAPCCAIRRMFTESRNQPRWVGYYGTETEEWNEHMGNFNDGRECAKACFCPFVLSHEIHTQLQYHSELPTNRWLDYACLLPCSMYGQTRTTYGIKKQNWAEDFCCGGFFYPCGLNRASKEVGRRELAMRQRAYAAGVGIAGKSRQGLRSIVLAANSANQEVAKEASPNRM